MFATVIYKNSENIVRATSGGYGTFRVLGKELGYDVPAGQLQHNADYKETDHEDQCFLYLRGNGFYNVEKIKYLGITIPNDLMWKTCKGQYDSWLHWT